MVNEAGFLSTVFPWKFKSLYNTTVTWHGSDLEKNYDPVDNLYKKTDITYKFNSSGFRCDEFDAPAEKRVVFLGCSMTEGTGVRQEETWAYVLLEKIRKDTGFIIPYWNLALGGCGLDAITRAFYHYHKILRPDIVIAFFPGYRRELYNRYKDNDSLVTYNTNDINLLENPVMVDYRTISYETTKNQAFLDIMIKSIYSVMLWTHWGETGYDDSFQIKDDSRLFYDRKGRDKMHPGPKSHAAFANEIYSKHKDLILHRIRTRASCGS